MAKRTGHIKSLDMKSYIKKHNLQHMIEENKFLTQLKLVENTRIRRVLGRCYFKTKTIELSTQILHEDATNQKEVLIHELCHYIAFIRYKDHGHGRAFKSMMARYFRPVKKSRYHQGELTTVVVREGGKKVIRLKADYIKEQQKFAEALKRVTAMTKYLENNEKSC